MKRLLLMLVACFVLTACSDKEGAVFYTAHYPIKRVEVKLKLSAADAEREAALRQIVLQDAPVEAGGSYQLDFNRYDGGLIKVRKTASADPIEGTFTKMPAAKEMDFAFGEEAYTVQCAPYREEGSTQQLTMLTTDLTERYRTQLEDETILLVERVEYTAYPAN